MPRVAKPRTPGEIATEEPSLTESAEPGETVTVEKSQLEAMFDQMQALTAKVQSLESANRPVRAVNPEAELPSADGVDVTKLKTPVLTKQGWLVPESYGSNPNAPKAF